MKKWFQEQGFPAIAVVSAVVILNFSFSAYRIEKFAAVDEPLWLFDRIEKYWNSLGSVEKWPKTLVNDKPGITVSLVSGIGLTRQNPNLYKPVSWQGQIFRPSHNIESLYRVFRLPIALFAALSLIVFYFFLEKLIGKQKALLGLIFIGLSPILIGMSRIINPDSLFWIFAPLSMLAFLNYLKYSQNFFLYASGILLGLSLLTKHVSTILYIFFIALIFLDYAFGKEKPERLAFNVYAKKLLFDYFKLASVSLAVFILFCPAVWVKPEIILESTLVSPSMRSIWPVFAGVLGFLAADTFILKSQIIFYILKLVEKNKKAVHFFFYSVFLLSIVFALLNVWSKMGFFNFEEILASPKPSSKTGWDTSFVKTYLADFYPLVFTIHPIALVSIVLGMIMAVFYKKGTFLGSAKVSFYLIIFILLYYLGSAFTGVVSTIRYQIIIFPIASILAAIYLDRLLEYSGIGKKISPTYIRLFLIFFLSLSLFRTFPFYFGYASFLLPKSYFVNIKDMGDGSYEAAEFLNALPDAQNINIWTDKTGVCYFFRGNCFQGFSVKGENLETLDYAVLSSGRQSRTTKLSRSKRKEIFDFEKIYEQDDNLAWKLEMGGRPGQYVKVVPLK